MPDFPNPFPGLVPDRIMTLRELTRALRLAMAAELEAISVYEAQADATDHPLAKRVLQDVANEERVHAGEFARLIQLLLADEQAYLDEGAAEVDTMAGQAPTAADGTVALAEAPAEATAEPAAPAVPTPPSIGSLR